MPLILILLLTLFATTASAQELTGHIHNDKGFPVANATVVLFDARDSALIDLTVSQTNGDYVFSSVKKGQYFMRICRIGYRSTTSTTFITDTTDLLLAGLALQPSATTTMHETPAQDKMVQVSINNEKEFSDLGTEEWELAHKSPGMRTYKGANLLMVDISEKKDQVTVFHFRPGTKQY